MKTDGPEVKAWTCDPLPPDVTRRLNWLRASDGIQRIAVMPDVHLSGSVCIGTVIASRDRIYPEAVGGDIGCGMVAVRADALAEEVLGAKNLAERVLRGLGTLVPTNKHSRLTMPSELPGGLGEEPLSAKTLESRRRRDALVQLGTLGRGNHFLELQCDDQGWLWLMVHSGSRAMGQAIAAHHSRFCLEEAGGLRFLEARSPEGVAYLNDAQWARRYAEVNRLEMVEAVAALLEEFYGVGLDRASLFSCDHNHVQSETHEGSDLWVHRKGALSARDGEAGIVPGSMGTVSFHTLGRGCPEALSSSSHGAGRTLSRTMARKRISVRELRRQMGGVWFDRSKEAQLRDEAPEAYKDVEAVMRAQRDLTRIVRRLRPMLVHKG